MDVIGAGASPQSGSCPMHGSSGNREHTPSGSSTNSAQNTGSHTMAVHPMVPSLHVQMLQLSPEGTSLPSSKLCPAASHGAFGGAVPASLVLPASVPASPAVGAQSMLVQTTFPS